MSYLGIFPAWAAFAFFAQFAYADTVATKENGTLMLLPPTGGFRHASGIQL